MKKTVVLNVFLADRPYINNKKRGANYEIINEWFGYGYDCWR